MGKDSMKLTRRQFIATSLTAACGLAFGMNSRAMSSLLNGEAGKSGRSFTMWQIPSSTDTIGNSYVFRTDKGRIIVMDGGFEEEAGNLSELILKLGGTVEAWFISHPHRDHVGALSTILDDPDRKIKIKHVYHSRLTEEQIVQDPGKMDQGRCRKFYAALDAGVVPSDDIQTPGEIYRFDNVRIKVLSVAQHDLLNNCYNNSSMILRLWDRNISIVFLGDAGVECGDRALAGAYADDLNCDFMQMAHHGQSGCSHDFYKSVDFHACLWPTPTFVWTNNQGGGYNTGNLKTMDTRRWMQEKGIREHHVTCLEGLYEMKSGSLTPIDNFGILSV